MASPASSARVVRFGPFEANLHTRELRKHGMRLKLQEQPFQILAMLLESPGKLVTREEIRSKLWPQDTFVDFDHSLNTAVSRLRDVLNDTAGTPRFIETLPRRGYRFLAPLESVSAPTVAAAPPGDSDLVGFPPDTAKEPHSALSPPMPAEGIAQPIPAEDQVAPAKRNLNWRPAYAIVGIAAAVVLAYFSWTKWFRAPQPLDSLAVLPLVNSNHDPELEYLGDGIAESVISHLSQVPGLKVMSRNSTFRYHQPDVKPQQVAQELGVKALLLGSIRKHGDELRIAVELVDASDEHQIWGEDYTRKMTNLSGIQSEIASEVSRRLHLQLEESVRSRIAEQDTLNSDAYRFYLRGRYALAKRTNADIREGLEHFKKAVELDPGYALAYVGMGNSYTLLAFYGGMRPHEAYPLAAAALHRTLALAPDLSDGYVLRAVYRGFPKMDLVGAEADLRRAIEISPTSEDAHHGYSILLADQGRFEEALSEDKKVIQLDPLWDGSYSSLAALLYTFGLYDQAIAEAAKAPNQYPSRWIVGLSYEGQKDYVRAIATLQETVKLSPGGFADADLARIFAVSGHRQEAEAILRRLLKRRESGYFPAYKIASIYLGFNDDAQVLRWLRIACDEEDPWLQRINTDPLFEKYRLRPEIAEIKRKLIAQAQIFPD